MRNTFKSSTPTVQGAVMLTVAALISFTMPFICLLVLRFDPERLGVFWLLYLVLAIFATVASLLASWRRELRHPFSSRRLLFTLYGSPFVLTLLVAGCAMKR